MASYFQDGGHDVMTSARTTVGRTPAGQSGTRNSDSFGSFKRFLKTIIFSLAATSVTSALWLCYNEMRYINLNFTYLLTYLLTYFP